MAHLVVQVIERCENAKEDQCLNLSDCSLAKIPDAVYHLMRETELKTCSLSSNVIKSIPSKFVISFNALTDLDLSYNHIAKLPDEMENMTGLERLNISYNSFIVLPHVVFRLKQLRELNASNNAIIEIDTDDMLIASECLAVVDLRHNPFIRACYRRLKSAVTPFRLEISELSEEDEW